METMWISSIWNVHQPAQGTSSPWMALMYSFAAACTGEQGEIQTEWGTSNSNSQDLIVTKVLHATLLSAEAFATAATFLPEGCNPWWHMICLRYSTLGNGKEHLFLYNLLSASLRLFRTSCRLCRYSSVVWLVTRISSIYTYSHWSPCSSVSIMCWHMAGANATPNGNLVYVNRPLWVFTATKTW